MAAAGFVVAQPTATKPKSAPPLSTPKTFLADADAQLQQGNLKRILAEALPELRAALAYYEGTAAAKPPLVDDLEAKLKQESSHHRLGHYWRTLAVKCGTSKSDADKEWHSRWGAVNAELQARPTAVVDFLSSKRREWLQLFIGKAS
eukprot:5938532-Karenia_brevis.AAC.1